MTASFTAHLEPDLNSIRNWYELQLALLAEKRVRVVKMRQSG